MDSLTNGPLKKRKFESISNEGISQSHVINRLTSNKNEENDDNVSPTTETSTMVKPKRPRTAYNFFFRQERAKLLGLTPEEEHYNTQTTRTKKRRHRKSHGKMGFKDMVKYMATRWNQLDAKSRALFNSKAAKDKERYRNEIEAYNEALSQERRKLQQDSDERKEQDDAILQSRMIVKSTDVFTECTKSQDEPEQDQFKVDYGLEKNLIGFKTCESLAKRLSSVSFLGSQYYPYHSCGIVNNAITPTALSASLNTSGRTEFHNPPKFCFSAPQLPCLESMNGMNYAAASAVIVSAASSALSRDMYLKTAI